MAFKDNLVRIREFRGKKPMDIVRGIGVDKQLYYSWEAGTYKPSEDNLDLLASYLRVPRNLFFKDKITEHDMEIESDSEWFKRTIETLIHQNGETIHEFRLRSKDEIENLRKDKITLFELLTIQLKPPQDGKH